MHSLTATAITSLCILCTYSKRTYQFEADVSTIPWSGTSDELFFRLCNKQGVCGMFTRVPAGWQSLGQAYSYTYTTIEDIGAIHKVDIVHPGGDQLCIDHIKVDGVEYDENGHKWIDMPHCIEDSDGGGCDTVTIILPTNSWTSRLTVPCEYQSILHDTYQPTPQPTDTTRSPTVRPTNPPSVRPTDAPTPTPTDQPTELPSVSPTVRPTAIPTVSPTTPKPTLRPSRVPSEAPTDSPTESPTEEASRQVVEPPPEVSKNGGVEAQDEETDEGGDANSLSNSDTADTPNGVVLGALIGGLTGLVLCLCGILLTLWFCWRQRMNMKDGMEEVNQRDPEEDEEKCINLSAESRCSDQEGLCMASNITGTAGAGTTSTKHGGHKQAQYVQIGMDDENAGESDQHEDDTEDDEEDGLYDHERRNMTRIDLDEDEDVVPE